jgi:hypothetical protein
MPLSFLHVVDMASSLWQDGRSHLYCVIEFDEEDQVMSQRLRQIIASNFARKIVLLISIAGFLYFSGAALYGRPRTFVRHETAEASSKDSGWKPLSPQQATLLVSEVRRSGTRPCRFAILYNCTDNCIVIADSVYNALRSAECLGGQPQFQDFAAQEISGIIVTPGILGSDDTPAWELEGALEGIGLPVREEDAGSGSISGEPFVQIIVSNKPPGASLKDHSSP